MVRWVDPQQLLEEPPDGVVRDVEREQRRRLEAEPAVEQQQDPDADEVVDELVEERRMEGRVLGVVRDPVVEVDLQAPRQVGRLAVELLVEPVAPAPDSLREEEAGRDRVGEVPHARARAPDDDPAGDAPEQDPAPDAEPALPDGEDPLPLRVRDLVPARDVVVRASADDPERDAPDRDPQHEIPIAAAPHPAHAGQPDTARDREQQHQAVHVDRHRPDVDRAGVRRRDGREDHGLDILPARF